MPEAKTRSGIVSIIGRPNTGKSTLLNKIVGQKVAIVSRIPQTTRHQIRGIYNEERGQIVFIDTPGVHKARDQLDQFMNQSAASVTTDVDCLIYLVDAHDTVGPEEEALIRQLYPSKIPLIFGLNKIDLKKNRIPDYINLWEKVSGKSVQQIKNLTLLPLSGQDGTNVEKLIDLVFEQLPEGPPLYPKETVTDTPQRMMIADIIREKFLRTLRNELPHSLGVVIEQMQPRKKKTLHIQALILVETDSHKSIVIGKRGELLKTAGSEARAELESLFETKIFLELFVKARKDWRNSPSYLQEMGYDF